LHCFATLIQDKLYFKESAVGQTFIRYEQQEKASKQFMSILRGRYADLNEWRVKARGMVESIAVEGQDVDFIDIDQLFAAMVLGF
jgi:hypothetical protein